MYFKDWIDIENPVHIEAIQHLMTKGAFPEGFVPQDVEMEMHWLPSLLGVLALKYIKEKTANNLRLPRTSSPQLPWVNKADRLPAQGQYVLFRSNSASDLPGRRIMCGYYSHVQEGDVHWPKEKGPVWKTPSTWFADASIEAWVSLEGEC